MEIPERKKIEEKSILNENYAQKGGRNSIKPTRPCPPPKPAPSPLKHKESDDK